MSEPTYLIAGASRGIGFALAQQLLGEGMQVIACCRQPQFSEGAKQLANIGADVYALDINNDNSIQQLCAKLEERYSHIDVLINCIGILHDSHIQPEKQLRQIQRKHLSAVFETNCFGHIMLIQAMEPLLKQADQFVCASVSARVGSISDNRLGGWYSYRSSKAALNMLLKNVSIEFSRKYKDKAKVLLLHPGTTDTDLSKPFQGNMDWRLYTPLETARNLLQVMRSDSYLETGGFYAFDGSAVAY